MRKPSHRRQRGEIFFARLDFASVPFETDEERDYLLVTRAFDPTVVSIARATMRLAIDSASRPLIVPAYAVAHDDGRAAMIGVGRTCQLARAADRAGVDLARLIAAFDTAAQRAGLPLHLIERIDIPAPLLRAALQIEAFGQHDLDEEWSLAGYEALFVHRPRDIAELAAALPARADPVAIAMRLAWLGEITFETATPIDRAAARFKHTPVYATLAHDGAVTLAEAC